MNKRIVLVLSCVAAVLAAAGALLPAAFAMVAPAVAGDMDDPKEFYFTRLINPEYPEKFSGQTYRLGMNLIIFGMTR